MITNTEFEQQFLSGAIKIQSDDSEKQLQLEIENGLLIELDTIYTAVAERLKRMIDSQEGEDPLYLKVDDQTLFIGSVELTFDFYTRMHNLLNLYNPKYYVVTNGETFEFHKKMLLSSAKIPEMEQKDYFIR